VVGSVASSVLGEPRATNDLDLVIQVSIGDAEKLLAAFPTDRFYLPPIEVLQVELARGHGSHLNVIALDSMINADLYPVPANQQAWFSRRRAESVQGRTIWIAAPEVVVLNKLIFYRDGGGEKHLRDVRGILATQSDRFDRKWTEAEALRFGVGRQWRQALGE
jgi:hypothetical protein